MPEKTTMKNLLTFLMCAVLLIGASVLTGCKSVEKTTYKAAGVTAATVDRAMLSWGAFVAHQKAIGTPVALSDELKVKQAFNAYQAALKTVVDAGSEYSRVQASGDNTGIPAAQSALNTAAAVLGASMSSLVNLIASFGVPVN